METYFGHAVRQDKLCRRVGVHFGLTLSKLPSARGFLSDLGNTLRCAFWSPLILGISRAWRSRNLGTRISCDRVILCDRFFAFSNQPEQSGLTDFPIDYDARDSPRGLIETV